MDFKGLCGGEETSVAEIVGGGENGASDGAGHGQHAGGTPRVCEVGIAWNAVAEHERLAGEVVLAEERNGGGFALVDAAGQILCK